MSKKIKRAATTASSLEAEHEQWCQDTILGDVDAQTRFETTSKQSNDPPLSRGYTLGSGEDSMKLLELMELCTQLSNKNRQSDLVIGLLNTVRHNIVLSVQVNAARPNLVLPVQVNATKDLLCLNMSFLSQHILPSTVLGNRQRQTLIMVERGTDCLPTAIIFEELAQMGRKQRKDTAFTQEETQQDDSVPTPSNDPPLSCEDSMQLYELMILCTNLQKQVLDLEKAKDTQAKEIVDLKKRVQKFERTKKSRTTGLKRLRKVGMSRRVKSSKDKDSLGDHEDASKQGRSIEDIDKDADVSLVNNTQGRSDNEEMFDINDLHSDEVNVDMPVGEKQEQSAKEIEVDTSVEDIDENLARSLQAQLEAELIEEERLARKKKEEANIALIESWDNTQAMMEADFELAQRLQTEEQGKITIEERSRLFVELMNKRKKHFAMLRAEEKRRKPPTKAQKRNQMSTYLKNMDGSSKRYTSMIRMLQGIDREDLQALWKLVKTKHGDTRPEC
ncbi:hypothetical protein Tco_1110112 [Tanacetum coccineum]|uniref:Uncharacterized protein n=1 Tax=Tanacetum coccineum TaxID=301880 RepID=A0ABQ5IKE5_9ASTR